MNILHIMKDYKPNTGGSVVRNSNMIENYHNCFNDNISIINLDGSLFPYDSDENGIFVMRCQSLKEMIKKTIAYVNEKEIDIIQVHNFRFLFVGYIAKQMAKKKVKLSVELHAIYRMSSYKEALSYWLLKRADLISVLSESAKNYLVREKKINPDKILVLRNGVSKLSEAKEESELKNELHGISKDRCIAAYTGSFIEWQGVRFLAENFDELAKSFPQLYLVMLGDGPDFEYVKDTISKGKFGNRAIVHQSVSKQILAGIMDEVDIVVIPREKNLCTNTAIPLKAIEAMQMGKCILASDDNGLTELLNENNSRVFEAFNTESMKNALSSIIDDEKLRETLGEQAKKDAEKSLQTWEANVTDLHDAYIRIYGA